MWLKRSTPYGSKIFFLANYPKLLAKPGENHIPHIFIDDHSKRPSSQSHLHVVACGLVWPRAGLSPRCCSVCVWTTYLHPPATYADDTAVVATSRSPPLLVVYLEDYLGRLERWLRDWRIAINVSKSTALLFVETARRILKPRPVSLTANTLGRNSTVPWGDQCYTANLGGTHQTGRKNDSSKSGRAWPPP
jgi:hypothetical protein